MLGRGCRGGEGPLLPTVLGMYRGSGLPRHKGRDINCVGCFRGGLFQVGSTPAGLARLFCRECDAIISARGFQRRDQTDLPQVASLIGGAIGEGGPQFDCIETASRFLWLLRPEGMPYIAALSFPLPYGQRPSITAGAAPLASLPEHHEVPPPKRVGSVLNLRSENGLTAAGPRYRQKRRLEISAVQSRARGAGNRQADAPRPQWRMRPNR